MAFFSTLYKADRAGSVDQMNVDIKPAEDVKKDSMDTQGMQYVLLPGCPKPSFDNQLTVKQLKPVMES